VTVDAIGARRPNVLFGWCCCSGDELGRHVHSVMHDALHARVELMEYYRRLMHPVLVSPATNQSTTKMRLSVAHNSD
jgi:hypothetical protein